MQKYGFIFSKQKIIPKRNKQMIFDKRIILESLIL